jgi:hypothetical protein
MCRGTLSLNEESRVSRSRRAAALVLGVPLVGDEADAFDRALQKLMVFRERGWRPPSVEVVPTTSAWGACCYGPPRVDDQTDVVPDSKPSLKMKPLSATHLKIRRSPTIPLSMQRFHLVRGVS